MIVLNTVNLLRNYSIEDFTFMRHTITWVQSEVEFLNTTGVKVI